jgi:hypothetical protein
MYYIPTRYAVIFVLLVGISLKPPCNVLPAHICLLRVKMSLDPLASESNHRAVSVAAWWSLTAAIPYPLTATARRRAHHWQWHHCHTAATLPVAVVLATGSVLFWSFWPSSLQASESTLLESPLSPCQ